MARAEGRWSGIRSNTDPDYNPRHSRPNHQPDHQYSSHPLHATLHLSHSMPSLNARYNQADPIPIGDFQRPNEDGLHFRPEERDLMRRTSYAPGSAPSSWQPSAILSRSLPTNYMSGFESNALPCETIPGQVPSTMDASFGGLSRDSTLLTPLPGYGNSSMLSTNTGVTEYGDHQPYSRAYGDELRPRERQITLVGSNADAGYQL